jgi:hypothetical protein
VALAAQPAATGKEQQLTRIYTEKQPDGHGSNRTACGIRDNPTVIRVDPRELLLFCRVKDGRKERCSCDHQNSNRFT